MNNTFEQSILAAPSTRRRLLASMLAGFFTVVVIDAVARRDSAPATSTPSASPTPAEAPAFYLPQAGTSLTNEGTPVFTSTQELSPVAPQGGVEEPSVI